MQYAPSDVWYVVKFIRHIITYYLSICHLRFIKQTTTATSKRGGLIANVVIRKRKSRASFGPGKPIGRMTQIGEGRTKNFSWSLVANHFMHSIVRFSASGRGVHLLTLQE
jgi:hypothetical protein